MIFKKVYLIIIIMYEIKSYPMISIDKKYCNNTKSKYLDKLRTCTDCEKLPLPSYKTSSKSGNTYCKICYYRHNFDPNNYIENTTQQEFFLEKLIINCKFKNEGCLRNFGIKTLQELIDHEKVCSFRKEIRTIQLRSQIADLSLKIDTSLEKHNSHLINLIKTNDSKIEQEILTNLTNVDSQTTFLIFG